MSTFPFPLLVPRRHRRTWRRAARRGMSLVEVMVVIAIVLTLMGILAWGIFDVFEQSRARTTELQLHRTAQQIESFALQHGLPEVHDIDRAIEGGMPLDSWGTPLVYLRTGRGPRGFDLVSFGADGVEGGEGLDADLSLRKSMEVKL
ncbi:MAG: type II secretion system protein GspG [Myxococcota bacterium]